MTVGELRRPSWLAIASLGMTAFVIVIAEFLPVGVLPAIAGDAHVSLGLTSLVVLIPGLVAGISAPLIAVTSGHRDRRNVVIVLVSILLVSNAIGWLSESFTLFLVARVLLGLVLGGFWVIGPSFGARLAPGNSAVATSIVLAGISAGTVLGLPIGALIQASIGWRWSFAGDGMLAVLVLVFLILSIPRRIPTYRVTTADLFAVVSGQATRLVLILCALVITGQLAASTFIGALLAGLPGFSEKTVTVVLLVYGGVGLAGNLIAPRLGIGMPRLFLGASVALAIVFTLIAIQIHTPVPVIVLVIVWGVMWGAIPFVLQTWTITLVPHAPEAGSAVLVTVFQLCIALGSAISGFVVSVGGLNLVFFAAAGFLLAAFLVAVFSLALTHHGRLVSP